MRELRRAQDRDPCGRELQCQRDAVETTNHFRDRGGVLLGDPEVGVHRLRPLDEDPHGLAARDRGEFIGVGHAERSHGHDALTREAQAFAARREHEEPRAPVFERADQGGHRRQQVLAIVEHQEQLLRAQEADKGLDQFDARPRSQIEHRDDGVHDDVGVSDPVQLDQPRAVSECGQ